MRNLRISEDVRLAAVDLLSQLLKEERRWAHPRWVVEVHVTPGDLRRLMSLLRKVE